MRLTVLLLSFGILSISASVYSQDAKISIHLENKTIDDVFSAIKAQTSYSFWFNIKDVDIEKRVSLNASDASVKSVLTKTLEGQNVEFALYGNHIIITQKGSFSSMVNQQQQGITVTGTVTDQAGDPMPGVNVVVKGTVTGVVTGFDGKYSIAVPNKTAILLFSFIGYSSQEMEVGDRARISVTMEEDTREIEEVVVVGYGTQKKVNLTGAVSSVSSKDLTVAPVGNTTNALTGKLPGLTAIQSSGQPGSDKAALNIRSFGDPLVIVDGVEAAFHTIDPNMIESISMLKDGSASIYGSRAGNGVLLVTTKRGVQQKPVITFSTNLTLQGVTTMPKPTSAGQYAELDREKWIQSGKPIDQAPFTEEQIRKYYEGGDPQYPNTDWYKELIRNWAPMQQYNLSIRGGSEKIKYYGFAGYMKQETMWKKNGGEYQRYNLQSNIDASINNNLSFQLDLAAIIENDLTSVRSRGDGPYGDFWATIPIYPATLPDPTKISYADGLGTGGAHVSTNYEISGYNKLDNQNFKGTGALVYKVPGISGLTAKVLVNAIVNYNKAKTFSKPVNFYTYDYASDIYTLAGSWGSTAALTVQHERNMSFTTQASLNYDRVFAGVHHISALALFEGIDIRSDRTYTGRSNFLSPAVEQLFAGDNSTAMNDDEASEDGRVSYVGRVNYSYKDKYLLEATLRADATARFSPAKRWGYFPSVSAAWRISEENFMQNANYLDNLKLRASYGQSGNDNVVRFQYLTGYKLRNFAGYLIGDNPMKPIYSTGLANPNLSWEEIQITNVGIDFSFLNKKLYGEADAFYRKRTGIPATRLSTLPNTFGASLPQENINSMDNRGFELMLGTHFEINDFIFDVSGNIAWSRDKWIHYEEPEYTDPDNIRITKKSGNWSSRLFGYKSDKLFGSQAEIDALTFQQDNSNNTTLRQGDVRYINTNGDDRLDWRDQVELGASYPHWTMGFNINARYKNFDLTALFQGAFGYYRDVWLMKSTSKVPPEEVYKLRWTAQNNNTDALVPRYGGSSLNEAASDYRYKKASYMRLKSASLGYNIPKALLNKISVEQARISVSGTNLFTLDKLKKYNIDPEVPFNYNTSIGSAGYYYPQQRTISIGLNVSF